MAENIIEIANEDELPPALETNKVTIADDKEVVPLKKKELTQPTTTSLGGVSFPLSDILAKNKEVKADLGITEAELNKQIKSEELGKQIRTGLSKFRERQVGEDFNLNQPKPSEIKINKFQNVLSDINIKSANIQKDLIVKEKQLDDVKNKIEDPINTDEEKQRLLDEHNLLVEDYKNNINQLTELDKKYVILDKGIKAIDVMSDKDINNPIEDVVRGVGNLGIIAYNNSIPTIVKGADYLFADILDLNANPLAKTANVDDYMSQWADYFRNGGDKLSENLKIKADDDYSNVNIFEKDANGNYSNLSNPKAYVNFAGQMIGNIATTAAAGLTGGSGAAYLTGVAQTMPEVYNEAKKVYGDTYDGRQKSALLGLGISMIAGAFEESGVMPMVDDITKKALIKETTKEIIEKSANQNLTPEILQNLFTESYANSVKKLAGSVSKIGKNALNESVSEIKESVSSDLSKITADVFRDTDEKKFGTTYKDLAINAIENGVGGFVSAAPLSVFINTDIQQKNDISKLANISANDINHYKDVLQGIAELQQSGKISEKIANEYVKKYTQLVEADKKIPIQIQGSVRTDANELVQEKENIAKDIEGKDEALIEPQKQRINQINEELKQIANPQATKEGETIKTKIDENQVSSKEGRPEKGGSEKISPEKRIGEDVILQDEKGRESLLKPSEQVAEPVSPVAEAEQLKQDLDKEIEVAKQKLRKAASSSLSSGGLQALPEFVNLVKLYYKKGQYKVDEFISLAKTFFGDKFTDEQIKDAHDKIISEEIKTNEALKQKVEDIKYEQGFKTELEKEKSAKKIEALKQKIKTQKDNLSLAKQTVKDYIDTNRKELGGATDSELIGLIKKANDATTINQVEKIINAIDKVTGSVEYYNKVRSANSTVKGIKKLIKEKNKKINLSVTDKEVAKRLIGINPKMLSTEKLLNDFNDLAEKMLTGIARPKVKETKKAGITAENVGREYSNADAENAIIEFEKDIEKTKQNNFNKKIKKFIDELNLINISTKNLTDAEIEDLYKDTIAPKEDREVDNKEVKEEFLRDVVADKVDDFIINDLPNIQGATIDEERHLNNIAKVNVADLDYDQLGVLSNVIDNIVYNNDYAGAGRVTTIIEGTQNAKETTKYLKSLNTKIRDFANSTLNKKIRIGKDIPAKMRRLVFGDAKILADMKYKMGWARLENANAQNVKSVGEFEKTIDDASRDALKNGIDIKTAENTIKAGIFSTLDMTSDDPNISEQSFSELKEQIKQSYELMKAHSEDKKIQKMGEQTESIYKNWDLDNIKTIEEFRDKLEKGSKADIEVVKAVKKIQKAHEKIEPLLAESMENYSNNRWVSENNYTALVKKSIKNKYDADKLTTVPNIFGASSGVNKTKSSTTISRTNKLGKDQYIDMDFYRNQLDKFKESSIDAHTLKERMVLDNMLKNKEFREDVGNNVADGLRKLAIDKVNSMMGIQEQTSESGKYAEKVANAWTNFGVRRVLFGMTQVPKQSVVMVNTISQLGGAVKGLTEVIKAFKNTKGWDDFKMKYPISIRSSVESGTKRGLQMSESDRTNFNKQWNDFKEMLAKNKVTYNFKELADIKDNFQKSFLVGTDVAMAEASWRAYYTKYVKENEGRDVTDWTTEKGNDQAASYANEMINKFQNISDQTDASNMAKERGWGRLAYDVFAPLSSFAMAARYRMSDSANAIASKGVSSDTKKQAYKDLIGTAQEMAIYGIVATAITQLIMIPSANALLKSMDMEEIEDPKSFIEKWYERFFKDALLGGTTPIVEKIVPWLIDSSIRFMNEKNYQQDIHNMNNAIGAWERAKQVTSVPFTKERIAQEEKKIYDLQSIVNDEKKYRPLGTAPILDVGSGKFDLRTTQSMLSMFEFAREIYNSDEAKRIEKDFKQLDAERQAKLSTEQSPTKDAIITQHEINNLWKALSIEAAIFVIGGADMTNIISRANKEQMKQLKYKYYGSENYNKRIIGTGFYTRKQSEADKRANIEAAKRR